MWLIGSTWQAQKLWYMSLVDPWHVESSQTRDHTHVPCTGRQILNHWTTKEVYGYSFERRTSHRDGPSKAVSSQYSLNTSYMTTGSPGWRQDLNLGPSGSRACGPIPAALLQHSHQEGGGNSTHDNSQEVQAPQESMHGWMESKMWSVHTVD